MSELAERLRATQSELTHITNDVRSLLRALPPGASDALVDAMIAPVANALIESAIRLDPSTATQRLAEMAGKSCIDQRPAA